MDDKRPWPVDSTWLLDDGGTVSVIRILGYLFENDPCARAQVVFHCDGDDPGELYVEDVDRAHKFFYSIDKVLVISNG